MMEAKNRAVSVVRNVPSDVDTEDSEAFGVEECETYSNYRPVHLKRGTPHPHQLCEGSTLSCVNPPPISYELKMAAKFYEPGNRNERSHLSNAQLEAIIYACQSHQRFYNVQSDDTEAKTDKTLKGVDQMSVDELVQYGSSPKKIITQYRQGFFLGDGTGTGKSRVLAGIIYESEFSGLRQTLYVTASAGLFATVIEEIKTFLPEKKFLTIDDVLAWQTSKLPVYEWERNSILFITYKSFTINDKRRGIVQWLQEDFDGLMIFDEAHYAKGAHVTSGPSKAGTVVDMLQKQHPKSRVVYSTATAASEPHHLLFMNRLQIIGEGTAYENAAEFLDHMETMGVVALELLAIEMKMRGVFLSRVISHNNVQVHSIEASTRPWFEPIYKRCSQMWVLLTKYHMKSKGSISDDNGIEQTKAKKVGGDTSGFYGGALSFFSSLVVSSRLSTAHQLARDALKDGKSVIFGIQATGEAQFIKAFDKYQWNAGRPYSNAAAILRQVMTQIGVQLGCPKLYLQNGKVVRLGNWTARDEEIANSTVSDNVFKKSDNDGDIADEGLKPSKVPKYEEFEFTGWPKYSVGAYLQEVPFPTTTWSYREGIAPTKEMLARMYHELVPFLPINPLDELTDRIGESNVAELTGRNMRYIYDQKEKHWKKEKKDAREDGFEDFKQLEKRVCIISTAASTGYSLHSDKRYKNQQQRVHITLEYSWSPDQVMQQLGRSHRSNQAIEPIYYIIQSPILGEVRFIAIVAKRLKQLGAICHGQANANLLASKLSDVLCSPVGIAALNKAINKLSETFEHLMSSVQLETIGSRKSYFTRSNEDSIAKCFNRNLMLPMDVQKEFLRLVHIELSRSSVSNYSPLIELPDKNTDITLKSVQKYKVSLDSSLQVYTFVTSRLATREYIEEFLKTLDKPVKFYIKSPGIETMVVVETEVDGVYDAYFPYNKFPRRITAAQLTSYSLVESKNVFLSSWSYVVTSLETKPGCYHLVADGGCLKPGCMHRWGIRETVVLCGFTSFFLKKLARNFDIKFRLAKVNFTRNGKRYQCVGLLLEPTNQRQALDFINRNFQNL